jgi:cytoskeletal protein CcmA (bactofilin family)
MSELTTSGGVNNLFIGTGVSFTGSISVPNKAIISGNFSGELTASEVQIGNTGVITGTTTAEKIEVHGQLNEIVKCHSLLTIHSSGRVTGEIDYGEIEIERGGSFKGNMKQV